jgi:hypothetical protein
VEGRIHILTVVNGRSGAVKYTRKVKECEQRRIRDVMRKEAL